ncbi:sulfotransferase family 2 domain-containing protein [Kordiimonas marina]|uniref:sulfotransferase family 2 domain-containing protein n=1 Tax=Kordiimonas marina TaxID=2872312 RepID=UPI001FF48E6D|nr:sulfotransferase family 2 domain-containing protein [Kordiimonas marina]MCJ9428145.1 sulfotransferase family protein [Kordiimonas marina]
MDKGQNEQVSALVEQAQALLYDEAAEEAHALIRSGLEVHDHVRLWRFLRRILLILGEEEEAAAVMKRVIDHIHAPTPGELALASSPKSAFTRLQKHKMLFLHIPKCGSTTIKDMLYYSLTGARGEGHAHSLLAKEAPYAYEDRRTLGRDYADWFKFLVVRDPIARLRSYYRFNLVFTNDLSKEVPGRETYFGLDLQPDYDTFLKHLPRYRQIFRTLRAHTNRLSDIAGHDPAIFDWIGTVRAMDELRARLSAQSGVDIPPIHNFRSHEMATIEPNQALEAQAREQYGADYAAFGQYF